MADIETNNPKGKHQFRTTSKKPVRIDLTPMVDLGFLLITFFVFTSAMSKPVTMDIISPYDKSTSTDDICNSCVLTVLLDDNNVIHYYEGAFEKAALHTAGYNSIREVIQQKRKMVKAARGTTDQFVLIIKGADASSFKNFVDITDEVTINGIKRYYIDELTEAEKRKMAQQAVL